MEIIEKIIGKHSQRYFNLGYNLASTLETQGKFSEAAQQFEELLEILKTIKPNDTKIMQLQAHINSLRAKR